MTRVCHAITATIARPRAVYGCRFEYGTETKCGAGTRSRVHNEFSVTTNVK